jgi:alkyl sulfatase BDS1-like metallo-beta-lactamase superfamily hydrolase
MGGRDRVLTVAQQSFDGGDSQWAAELATRLIRIDRDDMAARRLKAAAFRKLGYAEINAIWRNWYLSAARGLEVIDPQVLRSGMARLARFVAPPISSRPCPPEPLLKDLRFGSRRRRRSTSS